MNFSLKQYPLISHWVPGFFVVLIISLSAYKWGPEDQMEAFKGLTGLPVFFSGLAFVVIPFLMGQFLDAIRDLLENRLDRKSPINWDFFIEGDKDKLESFQEYYFIFYVFDWNLALGIILSIILFFSLWLLYFVHDPPWKWLFVGLVVAAVGLFVFIWNAMSLRGEIKKYIDKYYASRDQKKI
jgi:hypothetical protein